MTDEPAPRPPKPDLTPRAQAELEARLKREAVALRDNLRRRKQQVRPIPDEPSGTE